VDGGFVRVVRFRRRLYDLRMSRDVYVHLLPSLFDPVELRCGVAVVIDVLRASTTIVHALAAGAESVIPCQDLDDAKRIAANLSTGNVLLGGERNGVLIEGFDLDNSPLRYTVESVADQTIVFTTTNGTRALLRSRLAERILIGSFVNLGAVVEVLQQIDGPIHLVCAGTQGKISAEDVLFAGAVAANVSATQRRFNTHHDETRIAMEFYRANSKDHATLLDAIRNGRGGKNLGVNGFDADIQRAAQIDLFQIVPMYDSEAEVIRAIV